MKSNNIKTIVLVVLTIFLITILGGMVLADEPEGPQCYLGDGTNSTYCEGLSGDILCNWVTDCWDSEGCCFSADFVAGGAENFNTGGCWNNDGDYDSCITNNACSWTPNNLNQAPWCGIKNINDAQDENADADSTDIGCCEDKGCWNFDGDASGCADAFGGGLCHLITNDPWCPDCCEPYHCHDIDVALVTEVGSSLSAEQLCNNMSKVNAPCNWTGGACGYPGGPSGGGFGFYDNVAGCMDSGGWWDDDLDTCEPPAGGTFSGGDGFMFGGGAHCWFADDMPLICNNITGCAYCVAGTGVYGVDNSSELNICNGKPTGLCEGHDEWGSQEFTNADNSRNLECSDVQVKQACLCGPMPHCSWNSSSEVQGNFCAAGSKTDAQMKACQPPVGISGAVVTFCEHPDALSNQTLCDTLSADYLMPCSWTNSQCGFNQGAVFGDSGDMDYNEIGSETLCTSAGGEWITEFYVEDGALKQDSWCDKGAMFDFATGMAVGNKGNCDTDCWACEFSSTGTGWSTVTEAEAECVSSSLGYCRWTNDSYSPNGLGRCDYPEEFSYGSGGNCDSNCGDCDFVSNAEVACGASTVGCQWLTDTNNPNGGYCISEDKKVCEGDCFSCYSRDECDASSVSCTWDTTFSLCKPEGFNGEVCFDGIDNDNDGWIDCGDSECSFDNFCGGAFFADCPKYATSGECNSAEAFDGVNCAWVTMPWEETGHCDMPGMDCWLHDDDETACEGADGCQVQSMGDGFCDINFTAVDDAGCMDIGDNTTCIAADGCSWVDEDWNPNGGFCDFFLFDECFSLDNNETACGLNANCTWMTDEWSFGGGWCEPACFGFNSTFCDGNLSGLCEMRTSICEPEHMGNFGGPMMGGGMGGPMKSGCPQYDGNQTGCEENSFTCVWIRDDNSGNNASVGGESGWCNDIAMNQMFGDMKEKSMHIADDGEDDVPNYVDLYDLRIKDLPDVYSFGMALRSGGSNYSAACFGYPADVSTMDQMAGGTNTSKYYIYLDTDGVMTGGCVAPYIDDEGNYEEMSGYEFYINYVARFNEDTNSIDHTKKLFKCSDGDWISTNILVTVSPLVTLTPGSYDGCPYGIPLLGIEKGSLEGFKDLYDSTESMRVLGTSANGTYNRSYPQDAVGAGYYTPGTSGFGFVDCADPTVKDPMCKNFQKFGFNIFEDCHGPADEDGDGLVNCDDSDCTNTPVCGGNFDFVADNNDNSTPAITFTQVDRLHNAAFIKFDTNEPANGSVKFYLADSNCTSLNATINDLGDPNFDFDDYKPFHFAPLEEESLGYNLANGTTYFYKVKVCDPSNNCGESACLNFTTKVEAEYKELIFKMDLPTGCAVDVPELNLTNFTFEAEIGDETYSVGVKTNTSVTRDMNISLSCGDAGLKFVGADVTKPKTIDMDGAVIWDQDQNYVGMNSSTKMWNKLIHDIGMGGYSDSIEVEFPMAFDADNDIEWCNDEAGECNAVDDYVTCYESDANGTSCKVPTSMGFSTYKVSTPSAAGTSGSSGGSSGKSGGAAVDGAEEIDEVVGVTGDDGEDGNESLNVTEEESKEIPLWLYGVFAVVAVLIILLAVIVIVKKK